MMTGVTGLVLAAGASSRLGQPKQLLPFGDATLLDATLNMARSCGFEQLVVALGGAAAEIEQTVDLSGVDIVHNDAFTTGCSSSIAASLPAIAPASRGFILLLGDQPFVSPDSVHRLVEAASAPGAAPIGVCDYDDASAHPFWLGRELFPMLATLHGDKGVWKQVDRYGDAVVRITVDGPVPGDADTWELYETLLAERAARLSRGELVL